MSERIFGLAAQFYPRQWYWSMENEPREARVMLCRADGNRLLILEHGNPWLGQESILRVHIEALGGMWSTEECQRLRRILEPMIPDSVEER